MLDRIYSQNIVPACPTLLMDNGSRHTALLMALPDTPPENWPKALLSAQAPVEQALGFLKEQKLPMPCRTALCTMGAFAGAEEQESLRAERIRLWKEALERTGGRPDLLLKDAAACPDGASLLNEAQKAFGTAFVSHSGAAAVLAALSVSALRDRSWREGITIVWAGHSHVQAFMVYQEKISGLYEQHADLSREALLADLAELRLNWLPDEQVRARGGHGCICGNLPEEAEGFRPTWILGPARARFEGCGRLLSPCGNDDFERCFGLLSGLTDGERS